MARIKLPFVSSEVTRHGKPVHYFRKRGVPRIRLPGTPGDAEFMGAYHACLEGRPVPPRNAPARQLTALHPKSFRWLCQQYMTHHKFTSLDVKTRRQRQSILTQICDAPISETNGVKMGDAPFAEMHSKAIRRIRDRKSATPEAANNWLKTLKALFKWACKEEFCAINPTKDVERISVSTEGFHTWTIEEIKQFEDYYPIGTIARLALSLLLYTGCRRSDVIAFGPQHIRDGSLTYTQHKNRNTNPVTLTLPILPVLARVIEATPPKHLTFLVSQQGKPYTARGFARRWLAWATAAGLPQCTPHGLRKAGAVRAAENGATANQMMAIFGWRDIRQAERYTKKATQKTLASDGMNTIASGDKTKTNVSHLWEKRSKRCDTGGE